MLKLRICGPARWLRRLFRLVTSGKQNPNIKIFTAREGGVEHVSADNMEPVRSYIADWVADRFASMATPA